MEKKGERSRIRASGQQQKERKQQKVGVKQAVSIEFEVIQ